MIIIDLIFVCLYWQWWGGKWLSGLGRAGMGKSHGERSSRQEFGPQNGDLPRASQKRRTSVEKELIWH